MWPLPGGLYRYFRSRFPKLLLHCYGVAATHLEKDKVRQPVMQYMHTFDHMTHLASQPSTRGAATRDV
jgi:hypothetical protein